MHKSRGFTLLEVVISIAALSLIGGFVLQMFLVSSQANEKAQNMDISSSKAQNCIESWLNDGHAPDVVFYDSSWFELKNQAGARFELTAKISNVSSFNTTATVVENFDSLSNETALVPSGKILGIYVTVIDLTADTEKSILCEYSTEKYFSKNGRVTE